MLSADIESCNIEDLEELRVCQEWVLMLFEVEIDRVRSGFDCELRI